MPSPNGNIEVELPVCPECKRVGLQPIASSVKYSCVGDVETKHKRVQMKRKLFRLVPGQDDD